jgi:Tol biopolymer transport system component
MKRLGFLVGLIISFMAFEARAQLSVDQFGKNRLQFKIFNWRYLSSENFDIYFYDGGADIAKQAAKYLEDEFERMTDLLGYAPYTKTRIFLYNSVNDLQQSNVGANRNNFSVGGETDFMKPQVEIAYPGLMSDFKHELVFKISQMLVKDMMFGGSIGDMFQSSYLLTLPEWYIDGAARYIAYGWNIELDDYMRDHFINGKPKKLNKYLGEDAKLIGQSVWNFIAERYGRTNIANILNLTRIIRKEDKSISNTLGISFNNFIEEWLNFYMDVSTYVLNSYTPPERNKIEIKNRRNYKYHKLKVSPDGKYLAYSRNYRGKYKVMLKDLESRKTIDIMSGGYKVINQQIEYELPLMSWIDNSNLAIISKKYGKNYLWFFNVNSRRRQKKELTRLNNIKDFDVSESGNLAVMSADLNGQSDIFLISLRRNSIKRITRDIYDDVNPKFMPGTSSIVFSSNRTSDSLKIEKKVNLEDLKDVYNLFIYSLDTTRNLLRRVTNTLSRNVNPTPTSATEIYYISNQQGINNLYKFDINRKIYTQITKFRSSIQDYDLSPNKSGIAFSMLDNGITSIYYYPNFDLNDNTFTPQTRRQEIINAKYVAEKIQSRRIMLKDSLTRAKLAEQQSKIFPDNVQTIKDNDVIPPDKVEVIEDDGEIQADKVEVLDTDNFVFQSIRDNQDDETPETSETQQEAETLEDIIEKRYEQPTKTSGEFIDTDNYVFDRDVVQETQKKESFLSKYRKFRKESEILGPFDYATQFSAQNLVTSFVIDPLLGFGIQLEMHMNDMLEDHKFLGGLLATTNLRSGKLFGEYQYLKHTIDFNVRYDRKSLYQGTETGSQKYALNQFEVGAALPFNNTSRIAIKPFYALTTYNDLDGLTLTNPTPSVETSSNVHYLGFKAEYTFDNTVVTGLNLISGAKGKVGYIMYQGINDPDRSFRNIFVDFRNYQKIHKEFVFATRFYYGRFMGPNPPSFLLGGLDNWLFNSTNVSGPNDPMVNRPLVDNSNQLFMQFVMPLRGFNYNTLNGRNAMLLNFELRFPIVKYFTTKPISSSFLRNLLFVGFYDIGSSWTGNSPFSNENSVNTQIIKNEGSPFQARIQNFKNPWLSSYGFGLRTVLLGYYMKFDLAYPIEDYKVGKPKFLVSLGYDF